MFVLFSVFICSYLHESLKKFHVDALSGRVTVKEALDYETNKQHILIMQVSNAKGRNTITRSPQRSFAKLVINVQDVSCRNVFC